MGQHVIDFRYRDYIASEDWKEKRRQRLELDGHECFDCGGTKRLEVHHLTYERLFNERMADLITLCNECHARLHGRGPKRLRVAGELTPRQAAEQNDAERDQRLLAAAKQLDDAVENFRVTALGMVGRPDLPYFDDLLFVIRWHASAATETLRAIREEERSRRRRRRAA